VGPVEVSEFMAVERYSHVMHLVSHVRGRLEPRKDAVDVLEASASATRLSDRRSAER
jgi:anthranilate/para-aminobenzoate synthase component I